jgi:predicted GIY-YIG superfamily endonuclease
MQNYSYVYVLDSKSAPNQRYYGLTDALERRLREHNNSGSTPQSSRLGASGLPRHSEIASMPQPLRSI